MARLLAFALLTAGAGATLAQSWPTKPIKIVLGQAAGAQLDVITRQIADRLAEGLGQPIIVDNRPGAGGVIGAEAVKSSPPDGYVLGIVHFAQMSVAPTMFAPLSYDPVADFSHVGVIYRGPQVLVANPALQVSTVDDLVAFAREHPGKLRYSSPGNGSPTHLFMEKFKQAAGIDIQHIPYKGPSAHLAVVAGEVDLLLEGVQTMLPLVRAGRLKALAIGGTQRVPVLADVPTFEERGIKGIGYVWVGMVAPRGTPTAVIARLNSELHRVAALPAVREQHESVGRILAVSTPEEMTALIRGEIPQWRDVVRVARIRAD